MSGRKKKSTPLERIVRGREGIIFLLGALAIWLLISCAGSWHGKYLFPTPLKVAQAFVSSLPELLKGTWSSFMILAPSYLLAVAAGAAIGLPAGTTPWISRALTPFARIASPVPPNVYIPYAIAILPGFKLSAGFVIFIAAFWPVFLNSAAGASATPSRHLDNARAIGLGRFETLWRIVLPASAPHIFSGMAVGLALSFIMLTVAELFGASSGLGRFVQFYADYADYPRMVAGIVYTGAITFLSMEALELLKRKTLFWTKAS